jgi:predicted dehydrogenase
MLNAAIVGLGWWGQKLVDTARSSRLIRFARGVDANPERAAEFAAANGMTLGTSYEDVLADAAIDAVVLATPHTQHRAQVEAAAAAGKHVYCEKPFALTRADAEAALVACHRAGVVIAVGHHFRFQPSIEALQRLTAAGALGTIMHAEGNYSHDWIANLPLDNWRTAPQESRAGGMTGMGIHVLDCFSFLVGRMRRISALSKHRLLDMPAGDTTAAFIEFENGATGTLATTLKTPFVWRLAVYGSDAWAEINGDRRIVVRRAGAEPEARELPAADNVGKNLDSFAAAALGQGAYHIDAAGILHTVAALDAVFRSADADGAWMEV